MLYDQKPTKIDDFKEAKEKEIKERVEKRKIKRREVVENNKFLKKKRNKRTIKKEAEMFTRLRELNNEFKNVKGQKKKKKKWTKKLKKCK